MSELDKCEECEKKDRATGSKGIDCSKCYIYLKRKQEKPECDDCHHWLMPFPMPHYWCYREEGCYLDES